MRLPQLGRDPLNPNRISPDTFMRCVIVIAFLTLPGCDFLEYGPNISTTTPSKDQVAQCRELMYINPDLEIEPLGYCLEPGIDHAIRFKFVAKTDDPSRLFVPSQVDASDFTPDFHFGPTSQHAKVAEKWWDVSSKELTGGTFIVPPPGSTAETRGLCVGFLRNDNGTLTVYILYFET